MSTLFALADLLSPDIQERLKLAFSTGSLVVTVYFWFVRANRERVSLKIYSVSGFEGSLESGGVGLWSGRLFLANRSIMPTAVVAATAELWWNGRWLTGQVVVGDENELPWNLPPTQVFAKTIRAAFDLGAETRREQVYEDQRVRFTFVTVEGTRVRTEIQTGGQCGVAV